MTASSGVQMICVNITRNITDSVNNSNGCEAVSNTHSQLSVGSIIMVLIYGIICIFGLVGNALVIFVISRYTKMKTVTNMYILNLSIADGIFLLGLPMIMTTALIRHWVFGFLLCKIFYILTCINMFTGTFTLAVMSGDRFLAVCYPITSMRYRTPKYAILAITCTWCVSLLVMFPVVLYAQNMENPELAGVYSCRVQWPLTGNIPPEKAYTAYSLVLGFLVPVLLIVVFYTMVVVRLRSTGPLVKSAEKRRSHRHVTRLVTCILAVYILCWMPYWAFQVHLIVTDLSTGLPLWKIMMFQAFTILSYANSMVNPCLYAFTNENFRESFISAFRCAPDPILNGRRGSDYTSSAPNNNSLSVNRKMHTEYEFTTLNNSSSGCDHDVRE